MINDPKDKHDLNDDETTATNVEEPAEIMEQELLEETVENEVLSPAVWKDPEDTSVFKAVNRDSEDLAVVNYQQIRDQRNDKSQQLLEVRRPTLKDWTQIFGELGRTQSIVESRLTKVWEHCLTIRENNSGVNFIELLQQSFLTDLKTLAIQNKKERLWNKLHKLAPSIKNIEQEDVLFQEYLRLVNQMNELLGELYAIREPTMKVWAKRYHYLSTGEEEMLAELRLIWVRCVNEYEFEAKERVVATRAGHHVHSKDGVKKLVKKTTSFNTYKFSAFRNFIINQLKRKYKCKKRIDEKGVPYEQTMMSLDHQYDEKDGDGITLHDVVPSPIRYEGRSLAADILIDKILVNSSIKDDAEMKYALDKLVYDPHIKSLEAACRLRSGTIAVDRSDRDLIYSSLVTKDDLWKSRLTHLIIEAGLYEHGFSLVSAQVWPKSIEFEIKVRDTQLLSRTRKAIKGAKLEKEFKLL